jgi:1-acyl-sn-glycerol-3-phosphate acyltransferase
LDAVIVRTPTKFGATYPPAPIPAEWTEQLGRGLTRWTLRWFFGAEHRDTHHIPREGPAILVSNHPSLIDPFTVAFGTKRWVTWLAFDEALSWPLAGAIMRIYHAIPLNLARPRPTSIKTAYATLAQGRMLGIFFEGERSFGWGLNQPLKKGAARMAIRAGVPIVPVTLAGGRRCWPRERAYPLPGKVIVRYHRPIDVARFRPELPRKERAALLTQELERIIGGSLPPDGRHRH